MPKKKSKPKVKESKTTATASETETIETPTELHTELPAVTTAAAESKKQSPTVTTESSTKAAWFTHFKTDRKLQIMVVGSIVLLALVGIVAVMSLQKQSVSIATKNTNTVNKVNKNNSVATVEQPTVLPRRLDGLVVAAADANNVPGCVMIENAAFDGVRPQAGLSAAQVVYEIIVEGGITRLMAVFAGEKAATVGPVRSARDTYLEFASELNCAYAHAGGSYTAMQAIPNFALRDLDGLREPKWFWRDNSKYSPHNLFTSTDNLYEAIKTGHSWTAAPTYAAWNFVDDKKITAGETADEVNILFGSSYNVTYNYNTELAAYERANGGVAHIDANTGKTLTARNVIIQKVPPGEYIEGKGRVNFSVTGEGEVYIFRLGKMEKGTWKKADRLARTQFFSTDGKEINLARGTSWVEIVPEGYEFNWK